MTQVTDLLRKPELSPGSGHEPSCSAHQHQGGIVAHVPSGWSVSEGSEGSVGVSVNELF